VSSQRLELDPDRVQGANHWGPVHTHTHTYFGIRIPSFDVVHVMTLPPPSPKVEGGSKGQVRPNCPGGQITTPFVHLHRRKEGHGNSNWRRDHFQGGGDAKFRQTGVEQRFAKAWERWGREQVRG